MLPSPAISIKVVERPRRLVGGPSDYKADAPEPARKRPVASACDAVAPAQVPIGVRRRIELSCAIIAAATANRAVVELTNADLKPRLLRAVVPEVRDEHKDAVLELISHAMRTEVHRRENTLRDVAVQAGVRGDFVAQVYCDGVVRYVNSVSP